MTGDQYRQLKEQVARNAKKKLNFPEARREWSKLDCEIPEPSIMESQVAMTLPKHSQPFKFTTKDLGDSRVVPQPDPSVKANFDPDHPKLKEVTFTIAPSTDEAKLNKTEKLFLARLRMLDYPWIGVQSITLKLGDDCRYTPDFSVIDQNGHFIIYETKGHMRDDAKVKLQVAARDFPMFKFIVVKLVNNQWEETPVKP
jgi:hypothetical protein